MVGFRGAFAASFVVLAGLGGASLGGAHGAELKITDVKAYVFLERAGRMSENIVGAPELSDAPRGGAPDGDTATGVFLDFTFEGDKNFSPKYATATVDLTQTSRAGQQVVTHKAFTGFVFGPEGIEHKAVFLENATCAPLAVSVHAGKSEKSVKLDFSCTEVHASK
jgi:hypothetical protein